MYTYFFFFTSLTLNTKTVSTILSQLCTVLNNDAWLRGSRENGEGKTVSWDGSELLKNI